MAVPGDLRTLLGRHRAVVCVGCGGVGKTTVAAALALAAARDGRRVLCLTIDPARRLAGALGLAAFPSHEVVVDRPWLASAGVPLAGELTVMMLDSKSTFDELVRRHAPSPARAEEILGNRVYVELSTNLAGTRSYMAMEKVHAVLAEGAYDLVVLDTPPSARALDFFDAPARMEAILDSPATRALVRAIQGSGRFGLSLAAAGLRRGLAALDRITGTTLLEEIAGLLAAMNELFGGFAGRAKDIGQRLRSGDVAYVLVTAPTPPALEDAAGLRDELARRGISIGAEVVNRMAPEAPELPPLEVLLGSPEWARLDLEPGVASSCLAAASAAAARRAKEERLLEGLSLRSGTARVLVPEALGPLHRPGQLLELGERLLEGDSGG
jgi:anion-transporting  ArsA/GET3 family ATPase